MPIENSTANLTIPFSITISTDNIHIDSLLCITAREGHFEIMILLNMYAVSLKTSRKTAS
jgi:hypothetical protein